MPQDPWAQLDSVPQAGNSADPWSALDNSNVALQNDVPSVDEEENIRRVVARLKAIKPANEEQRKHIADLIDKYETHGHNVASNLIRGLGAGVVSAIPQMASMLNQISGQKDPEIERINKINQFFDQGGTAGKVGEFVGQVVGSGPVYGKAVEMTGLGLSKLSPALGKVIASTARPGASIARHAAVNVLTGLPINVAQALGTYDIPVPEDATPEEKQSIAEQNTKNKLFNAGVGIVADALFGAAAEGASRGLRRFAAPKVDANAPPEALSAERQAALEAAKLKREAAEKTTAEAAKMRKLAAAEWTLAHPDQNWRKDLKPEERKKIIQDYLDRVARDQAAAKPGGGGEPPMPPAAGAETIPPEEEFARFAIESGGTYTGTKSGVVHKIPLEPVDDFGRPISPQVQQALEASKATREAAAADLAAHPNLDKPMTDAEIQAHADEGFNAAEANRPKVPLTPEQQAKQKEYNDLIALEEALSTVQERGGLQTEEQWNSFIEDVNLIKQRGLDEEATRKEIESLIEDYTPPETPGVPRRPPEDIVKEMNGHISQLTGENDNPETVAKVQQLYDQLKTEHGLTDEQIAEMQGKYLSSPLAPDPAVVQQYLRRRVQQQQAVSQLLRKHNVDVNTFMRVMADARNNDPRGDSFNNEITINAGYLTREEHVPGTNYSVHAATPEVPDHAVQALAKRPYLPPLVSQIAEGVRNTRKALEDVFGVASGLRADFGGISLMPDAIGVNMPAGLLKAWKNIIPSYPFQGEANRIFINPWAQFLEIQGLPGAREIVTSSPEQASKMLADLTMGTIVHEPVHDMVIGHEDDFSAVLTRLLGTAMRLNKDVHQAITDAWFETLTKYRKEFVDDLNDLNAFWATNQGPGGQTINISSSARRNTSLLNESRGEAGVPEGGGQRPNREGPEGRTGNIPEQAASAGEARNPAADAQGAERSALIAELVRTPIHQRGPILAKLRALNEAAQTAIAPAPDLSPNTPPSTPLEPAPPQTPSGTFLESVSYRKPIEEMTDEELGTLDDKIANYIEDESLPQSVRDAAIRDLNKIADYRIANATPRERPALPPEKFVDPNVTGAAREERIVPEEAPPSPDEEARKALRMKMMRGMRKLSDEEIKTAISDLETESNQIQIEIQDTADKAAAIRASIEGASEQDAKALRRQAQRLDISATDLKEQLAATKQTLDKVFAERADRFLGTGLKAQIPPTVGGGVAGFVGGLFLPSDNQEDRMNHAWIGLAAGMAGGAAIGRYNKMVKGQPEAPRTAAELPGGQWQAEMQKYVVTGAPKASRAMPFLERMRHIYWSTVRRSYAGERLSEALNANRLNTAANPGKLLSMFGRWSAMTESALRDGPSVVDDFGNPKHLGAPGVHEILNMVNGDVESLGILAAARSKVELGDAVKTPFDIITAENLYRSMPELFHQAADKLRQLSLGMADVAVWGGLLSKAARDKFAQETMYAPFMRIFKFESLASTISTEQWQNQLVRAANPIKARQGGSSALIKNPAESVFESIPRIYRAAELNRIKEAFLTSWEAAGKPDIGIKRLSKGQLPPNPEHDMLVAAVKAEMGFADPDAHALVTALDPKSVDVERGIMRIYRNNVVESYQIPPELARTMLSLSPDEMSLLTKMAGLPARVPAAGIVYNPFFIAKMGFFDMFQATANSAYGFRFGIDNIRGYLHIVARSRKYQDLLATGLSHQALAGGNLENIKTTTEALRQTAGSPIEVSIRHLKEGRPVQFYKAMVAPIADAARVGEALRALDHGASYLDAVFAAKNVVGNYAEIGAWHGMRALQHMTMFLGPALQVLDTAAYRSGVHPFRVSDAGRFKDFTRYFWKMGTAIGLPTALLWYKAESENDDEIRQMRTSEFGRRFWFYRLNWDVPGFGKQGEVIKIPKPILDGQLFGTSMEMALDNYKGQNPAAVDELIRGAGADAAFNLLPAIGVVPTALAFNKDPSTGWNVEPEGQQDILPEHRGEATASWLARNISRSAAPKFEGVNWPLLQRSLSPAGIDYLFNAVGGMLGRDAVTAVSAALEYQDTGYIPAKQEWPIVRQVFAQVPTRQTHEIQQFYREADRVEEVSKTIAHMMKEDPERLLPFMERHQAEYGVAAAYAKARTQIAGYRRAINDLRELPTDVVSSEDRRKMIAEYINYMNQTAAEVNDVALPLLKK